MDGVETRCHLDWHAHGQLTNNEDLEGFEFLCQDRRADRGAAHEPLLNGAYYRLFAQISEVR